MKRIVITMLFAVLFMAGSIDAAPVVFKCKTDNGLEKDLTIDIENKNMVLGNSTYKISNLNEKYISAYDINENYVGGEVIVFNRTSGEYIRGIVMFFGKKGEPSVESKLDGTIVRGRCTISIHSEAAV